MRSARTEQTKNVCNRLPLTTIARLHWLCEQADRYPSAVVRELIDQAEPTYLKTVRLKAIDGARDEGEHSEK